MAISTSGYTIGALAAAAGVHVETVRYYQRRGLMAEPPRPPGGVRRYGEQHAQRVCFIKRAQAMGFTLAEVDQLVRLRARRSCRATRELAAAKMRMVEVRIRELRRLRQELARLVADCDANTEETRCPMFDVLTRQPRGSART
jgi:MerR family transcriptional regulator, mercuric resistance operon regulatory protein